MPGKIKWSKEAVLVVWGILSSGYKVFSGFKKEGLIKAFEEVFPNSLRLIFYRFYLKCI